MNKKIIISLIINCLYFSTQGCPTCVGRVAQDKPVFFSDEFYTPGESSVDMTESTTTEGTQEQSQSELEKE